MSTIVAAPVTELAAMLRAVEREPLDPRAGLLEILWANKPEQLYAWKLNHECNQRTHVYFVRAGLGPIKIGTAADPQRRLSHIQVSHPEQLTLLGSWTGCSHVEAAIHTHFHRQRHRAEWFKPCPELLRLISAVRIAELELQWQRLDRL